MKVNPSERLCYSLMTANDATFLFQLDQDPEVMRYINGGKLTSMQSIEEFYIPRMQHFTNEKQGWGLWKVLLKDSKEFIGWVLVRPMAFFTDKAEIDNLELGWRFMQKTWGKGYATEAALTIKTALITHGNISKLTAIAFDDNIGSVNVMKKIGMSYFKSGVHTDPVGHVVYYQFEI